MLKQDQEFLSAPPMDCLCKSGASSWSSFNQSKQDRESLSAPSLDCLCRAGLNTWSDNFPFHKTILQILPLCKIMYPGPVGALLMTLSALSFIFELLDLDLFGCTGPFGSLLVFLVLFWPNLSLLVLRGSYFSTFLIFLVV